MLIRCSHCSEEMGIKPGVGVTHSICPSCYVAQRRQIREWKAAKEKREGFGVVRQEKRNEDQ